ncbi:arsenate reductase (glutaredoxin) [Fulvivirgaceae bacterium BMA10]|uniref:Arsenate reductase (Glutaredoxin) n=1 Tax=Splendidivirga corallicola TaxID=3051826 RepID=A0ABT8KJV5_9BACT|nr:arsenate reductase (glutaredoxin) [Fulvivirgaceae bacterium BMA10]
MLTIYHNPRCSKSRSTLQLIQENNQEVEIIEYLNQIPTKEDLRKILKKLKMDPAEIVRKGEAVYKENFKGKEFSNEEWLEILVDNPKLIERPIVVKGDKAVLGRPPENVKDLF